MYERRSKPLKASSASSLGALDDVDTTGAVDGDLLFFDGAEWIDTAQVFTFDDAGGRVFVTSDSSTPLVLQDATETGNTHTGYIQFNESDSTRQGYVGFASAGNQDNYLVSDNGAVRISGGNAVSWVHDGATLLGEAMSLPTLVLDSIGTGDTWDDQGAMIVLGESAGTEGTAALYLTYTGDGKSYIGMGGQTNGLPAQSKFRLTYNLPEICMGSQLYPADDSDNAYQTTGFLTVPDATNYGSVRVEGLVGTSGTYHGLSVVGRAVFMNNNSTLTGIYNDTNNQWMFNGSENSSVNVRYTGSTVARTSTFAGGTWHIGSVDGGAFESCVAGGKAYCENVNSTSSSPTHVEENDNSTVHVSLTGGDQSGEVLHTHSRALTDTLSMNIVTCTNAIGDPGAGQQSGVDFTTANAYQTQSSINGTGNNVDDLMSIAINLEDG